MAPGASAGDEHRRDAGEGCGDVTANREGSGERSSDDCE
jgi:hypothetical protein